MSLSIEDNVISPAILSHICEYLKNNKAHDLDTSLLLNAQALYLSGTHDLCLVQAVTALEIAVTRFMQWCFQGALTSDEILQVVVSVFKRYFGSEQIKDDIKKRKMDIPGRKLWLTESMGSLHDLLLTMHVFHSHSTNISSLIERCCDAIEARNKVAHQYKRGVSLDKIADELCNWLHDIGKIISLVEIICNQKGKTVESIWKEEIASINFDSSGELDIAPIAGMVSPPYRKSVQF